MADSSKLQYLVMKQDGNGVVVVGPDPSWGSVTMGSAQCSDGRSCFSNSSSWERSFTKHTENMAQ